MYLNLICFNTVQALKFKTIKALLCSIESFRFPYFKHKILIELFIIQKIRRYILYIKTTGIREPSSTHRARGKQ
jgi:hypothetical protein